MGVNRAVTLGYTYINSTSSMCVLAVHGTCEIRFESGSKKWYRDEVLHNGNDNGLNAVVAGSACLAQSLDNGILLEIVSFFRRDLD